MNSCVRAHKMARKHEDPFRLIERQLTQDTSLQAISLNKLKVHQQLGVSKDLKEIERVVRSVLVSTTGEYRVSDLVKDYCTLTGRPFPIRDLGFSSVFEILEHIPDACEILEDGTNDPLVRAKGVDKSAHILKLTKCKPKPKSKSSRKEKWDIVSCDLFVPFHVQDFIRSILFENEKCVKPDILYEKLSSKYDLEDMGLRDVPINILARSLPHLITFNGKYVKSSCDIQFSETEVPKDLNFPEEVIIPSYRISKLEKQISINILQLLKGKSFINVGEIPRLYLKKFGKSLNWERLGFRDLWKFLLLLPGNFKLVKSDGQYVLLSGDSDGMDGLCDLRERDASKFSGMKVQSMVLKEIKELALQMNMGFDLNYLETTYEGFYHKKLVLKTNIENFARQLHDLKIFTLRTENEKLVIYPFNEIDPEERNLRFADKQTELVDVDYPEGVMKPSETLKYLKFPKALNILERETCAVYATAISDPSNFYIKIAGIEEELGDEVDEVFLNVHQGMQTFYKLHYKQFRILNAHLRLDMICAGCIQGEWQRVRIEEFTGPKGFIVRTVDFGSVHCLRLGSLCYLLKAFASLPILAYKATLFNLKPLGNEWTLAASKDFVRFTGEGFKRKILIAMLVHRNQDNIFQVTLTDVSSKEDKHIGNVLLEQGHAKLKFTGLAYELYS